LNKFIPEGYIKITKYVAKRELFGFVISKEIVYNRITTENQLAIELNNPEMLVKELIIQPTF